MTAILLVAVALLVVLLVGALVELARVDRWFAEWERETEARWLALAKERNVRRRSGGGPYR